MKLTIKGMTASTIAFNTLGIVIRGDSKNPTLYKESVARHIDVVNEDQLSEVNSLVNAGLIAIENEDEIAKSIVISTPNGKSGVLHDRVVKTVAVQNSKETSSKSSAINNEDCDIEDAPKKTDTKSESKGRGRPKGSKNKKTIAKENKAEPKKIVKLSSSEKKNDDNSEDIESRTVVMTPSGPKGGNMTKNASGDIGESEITKASLEAMKKIEDDEAKERESANEEKFCDSDLNLSEKNGLSAVVSPDGNAKQVKMENSILPEASQIRERAINFIDEIDEPEVDAFIDDQPEIESNDKANENDDDTDFLEC